MSNIVKIHNAANDIEAQRMIDLLKSEGIYAFSQDVSSGEYVKIYAGFSVYGKNIYINAEDATKAMALIKDNQEPAVKEVPVIKEVPAKIPFYKNRTILVRIYLIVMLVIWIIVTVLNHI